MWALTVKLLQLEQTALQWSAYSATRKLFLGKSENPTTDTKDLVASSHLHRLRDRLRPLKVALPIHCPLSRIGLCPEHA